MTAAQVRHTDGSRMAWLLRVISRDYSMMVLFARTPQGCDWKRLPNAIRLTEAALDDAVAWTCIDLIPIVNCPALRHGYEQQAV